MSSDQMTIALVGSPNSGKTTLFNWLTGASFRAVNYAGSTVDCHRGSSLPVYGSKTHVLDTPGIYSLRPHGPEEEITLKTLTEDASVRAVIVVIDGTQLNRQLYLVRQIQTLGVPMVIAVTMMDLVKRSGRSVNLSRLSELTGAKVLSVDGRLGGGVKEVLSAARDVAQARSLKTLNMDWSDEQIEKEIAVAESWTRQVVQRKSSDGLHELRRWDRIFLHPFWGIVSFVLIMGLMFSSIFWLAAPLMDWVDAGFARLAQLSLSLLGDNDFIDFIANGLISGIGAVLVFVPQIFILFLGMSLLEDTGYLARAATIVDRPLHSLGLSGRAFVPVLSGFACAVPAVMASRNIRSARERWITVFIIPFMTCSARLPVYALLLTFLFGVDQSLKAGFALAGLYLGAVVIGAVAAGVLNRILKPTADSHFMLELPIYRMPKASFTIKTALRRTWSYVQKAGPTIFVFVVLLWLGTNFPHRAGETPAQRIENSYVGRLGQVIEPVFEPMGLDWRAGLGIMSAFVAREVFVSSLAVIFNIADEEEDSIQSSLLQSMRSATRSDGTPLFTVASVSGLIIFFMIALQCLSTTGVTLREMKSVKFAVVQLVSMNLIAYVAAVLITKALS